MTLTSPRDEGSLGTTGLVASKMSAFVRTQARNSGPWILRKTSRVGLPFNIASSKLISPSLQSKLSSGPVLLAPQSLLSTDLAVGQLQNTKTRAWVLLVAFTQRSWTALQPSHVHRLWPRTAVTPILLRTLNASSCSDANSERSWVAVSVCAAWKVHQ